MDSRERKKQKDAATSVKVELPHLTQPREGHILHEQEYNTGHGIQAIPNEIRTEIWTQPSQPEVQQKPVIYLFPADTLEREYGVSGPSAPAASQPPKPAYRSGAEADLGYAPPQSKARPGGAVAPPETARLQSPAREPILSHAQNWGCSHRRRRNRLICLNLTSR